MEIIGNRWDEFFNLEFKKDYFIKLKKFLEDEYSKNEIYPKKEDIFKAFKITDYDDVKIVILGQDPYHGDGEANGLAFSVNDGIKIPPSLKNIYKEINNELNIDNSDYGDLTKWAEQGVLLLNTVLTVRRDEANSHRNSGWEIFTDNVIKCLSERDDEIIFLLWGKPAQKKEKLIGDNHTIFKTSHPSPLSSYRGFFGCNHFLDANRRLKKIGKLPINWSVK